MNHNVRTYLVLAGICIVAILLMLWRIQIRKEIGAQIRENLRYAIGTYLYVSGGGPTRGGTYLSFSFDAVNEKMEGVTTKGKFGNYDKAQRGDHFLVIYDTTNPENCQILFDYPIKDSTDFIRYLEEFKTKPLDFDKYF